MSSHNFHEPTGYGHRTNRVASWLMLFCLLTGLAHAADPVPPTAEQLDFFENKIRPILVDSCYRCHSAEAEKSKGGLFLDTRAGVLAGGDTGLSIVAGDAAKSLLIEAVKRLDEDSAMPPKEKEKLSAAQIADLEKWVAMGAPDPRSGAKALTDIEKLMEAGKKHWAFMPVVKSKPPTVKTMNRVQGEVDHFILAGLEAKGLGFSKAASPRTLLRRVYFDLIGLPPTVEQIAAFEKASAANAGTAFSAVVEELLASPQYGERWGRHWLDIARYADNSGGYGNVGEGEYPHAHTYRDYVIRSFNEDKPYDQFVLEQLAADHLDLPEDDNRALAAMGFYTVGFKRANRRDDDVTDDQIDTISRGLLAMSVGCARCHDHKLEPIPTRDYYSLYGILRSSEEPAARPELKPLPDSPELTDYREKNAVIRAEFIRVHAFEAEKQLVSQYAQIGDYLQAVRDGDYKTRYEDDTIPASILNPRNLNVGLYDAFVAAWEKLVKGQPKLFRPWLELSALPPAEFAAKAPALCKQYAANKDKSLDGNVAAVFKNIEPTSLQDIVWAYNNVFASIETQWGERFRGELKRICEPKGDEMSLPQKELAIRAVDRIGEVYQSAKLPDTYPLAPLMQWITAEGSPFAIDGTRFMNLQLYSRNVAKGVRRDVITNLVEIAKHPGSPPQAMVMVDAKKFFTARVFIRGNAKTKGILAPRQFFEILAGADQKPFPKETSGRLEFAKAVIDPKNPLTARVIVNRVWQWHFGEGLVRTASDFGFRGEKPTHPKLLDYLTARFVEEGWSLKKLHRWMLLSSTYQQISTTVAAQEIADPGNRLWRRMNSRQLEFEPFRDTLLSVSGRLDLSAPGGSADDIIADTQTTRRTVYAKVDRKTFPNLFRIFDFPPPSFTTAKRKITTLTPQSLYMLNSSFIADNAKALAKEAKTKKEVAQGIADLYRRVLQRQPDAAELASATKFLAAYPKTDQVIPEATDWLYGYGEFDTVAGKVKGFTSLSKFSGETVKGIKQKDMDLSGMEINAKGGKVAQDRATIRRWTAPYEGTVNIYAELLHNNLVEAADGKPQPKPEGDGVNCHVVSNIGGKLGTWSAFNTAVMTLVSDIKVKPGDTLDFVTLCGDDAKGDTFTWAPTITMKDRDIPSMKGMAMRWDARTNFMDPSKMPEPIGPWEELAQVLLLSNEFAVVD